MVVGSSLPAVAIARFVELCAIFIDLIDVAVSSSKVSMAKVLMATGHRGGVLADCDK